MRTRPACYMELLLNKLPAKDAYPALKPSGSQKALV